MQETKKEKMVKIPYSLYTDLIHYFLIGSAEPMESIVARIKDALKDKQDANERRVLYTAKLASEGRVKWKK